MNTPALKQLSYYLLAFPVFLLVACSPSNDGGNRTEKQQPSATVETAADFPYHFEPVADNTWVMHGPLELPNPQNKGFMNNPGLVKTSAGLVIIDPGSTVHVGKHVISEIKKISGLPVVAVFNTHIHGDHWLANQAIRETYPGVKIYGHPKMRAAVANGEGDNWVALMETMTDGTSKGTRVVAPDHSADDSNVFKVGNTQFRVHHYGVAHTNNDIMIEVVENSVLFLGDNVLAKRLPRMSDGTFQGSIDTINKVLENDIKTWVPGHGPSGDKTMVQNYLNYISLIYQAAQQAFEDDLDSSDVIAITRKSTAAYKDWSGYEEQLGPHGAQAYAEVEAAEF